VCGELTSVLVSLGPLGALLERNQTWNKNLKGDNYIQITMPKYICECGESKELSTLTIKVIDGKVRTVESKCECGKYMKEADVSFKGFPNLIRTEATLRKK